jgi:uncharacterized protein (TIGR00369 family)
VSEDRPPPPAGHAVGAYFRFERWELPPAPGTEGPSAFGGRAPVDDHQRGPGGGLVTGGLLTCIDSLGGLLCGLAVLPKWIVTGSLAVQVLEADQVGPLGFDARVLRQGRHSVVGSVSVVDEGAGGTPVAASVMTCAVLDPGDMALTFARPLRIPLPPPDPDPQPVEAFFGIEPGEGPVTRLHLDDRLRNPWGILHGGAVATLVDVAACRAAQSTAGGAAVVTGVVIHYVAPVRVGPVEARCTALGSRAGGTVVRVAVHDTGAGDRLVALASVTVREG